MHVAILTVGEEVLAGDIENTNASWLAARLTDQGASVDRILTIPDERQLIADTVAEWAETFDAAVVTGGLGGTHDDVTAEALADAFGRELVVDGAARQDAIASIAAYRDRNPEDIDVSDIDFDVDAWATLPAGSRTLLNPAGLCPGCVVENVYAFPGVPDEVQALFEQVADEFGGDAVSQVLYTPLPEAALAEPVREVRDRFDVGVGSYPSKERHNRIKLVGTDPDKLEEAAAFLRDSVDVVEES